MQAFLKGASKLRPPVVHHFPSWELSIVLRALSEAPFEPLKSSSIRHLSFKTAYLVAITLARRVLELAALSIRQELCMVHSDRVVLRLITRFIPKVNSYYLAGTRDVRDLLTLGNTVGIPLMF